MKSIADDLRDETAQDLWDIRELLNQPDMEVVAQRVDEGIATSSAPMRERWATIRRS